MPPFAHPLPHWPVTHDVFRERQVEIPLGPVCSVCSSVPPSPVYARSPARAPLMSLSPLAARDIGARSMGYAVPWTTTTAMMQRREREHIWNNSKPAPPSQVVLLPYTRTRCHVVQSRGRRGEARHKHKEPTSRVFSYARNVCVCVYVRVSCQRLSQPGIEGRPPSLSSPSKTPASPQSRP